MLKELKKLKGIKTLDRLQKSQIFGGAVAFCGGSLHHCQIGCAAPNECLCVRNSRAQYVWTCMAAPGGPTPN